MVCVLRTWIHLLWYCGWRGGLFPNKSLFWRQRKQTNSETKLTPTCLCHKKFTVMLKHSTKTLGDGIPPSQDSNPPLVKNWKTQSTSTLLGLEPRDPWMIGIPLWLQTCRTCLEEITVVIFALPTKNSTKTLGDGIPPRWRICHICLSKYLFVVCVLCFVFCVPFCGIFVGEF